MSNKEVNIRSVLFLVMGILLLLSLVICIYIVNKEKDLVPVDAVVIDVKKDSDGTGKNDVTVLYEVGSASHRYNFYYKDDVDVNDVIKIYYHEKNISSVQSAKTSKWIFICPILGLVICVIGLFELFSKGKDDDDEEEFKTQVISIIGNTQQLKIVTPDDEDGISYQKTPEEEEEIEVKSISGKAEATYIQEKKNSKEEVSEVEENTEEAQTEEEVEVKQIDVILPSYYYVTSSSLVYEEKDEEAKEISFRKIRRVIKTINKLDNVVKLVIVTDDLKCVLTNVENVKLDEVANLLHNRMLAYDESFQEEIENKEF